MTESAEKFRGVESTSQSELATGFNTVGLISLILTAAAIGLCAVMFYLANQLPDNPADFGNETTTPAQLRLLILECSTAVLAIISFVMAIIGLLLPNRDRMMALLSAVGSFLVLAGVFGVVILALYLANSKPSGPAPAINSANESVSQ